jgi:hypothetical protein
MKTVAGSPGIVNLYLSGDEEKTKGDPERTGFKDRNRFLESVPDDGSDPRISNSPRRDDGGSGNVEIWGSDSIWGSVSGEGSDPRILESRDLPSEI